MTSTKASVSKILIPLAAVLIIAAAIIYFVSAPKGEPSAVLESELAQITVTGGNDGAAGKLLLSAAQDCFKAEPQNENRLSRKSVSCDVKVSYLDTDAVLNGISDDMQTVLTALVSEAKRPSEIYDDKGSFRSELCEKVYLQALEARLLNTDRFCKSVTVPVRLDYEDGQWRVQNINDVKKYAEVTSDALPGYTAACRELEYVPLSYSLPDLTSDAPAPDGELFGETTDPKVISELLAGEKAQRLINGQKLDWNPDKELIPGRSIYYYLDDTVLALVWQEVEQGAVGTFAEVIISDATQLRRKLSAENYGDIAWRVPTELAEEANAVVAVSGDFYLNNRPYGVYVYDREVKRCFPDGGQTCYFTDEGDMIFSYERQFADIGEAQDFVNENNVMFSLNFGPVILDNGVDVVPDDYPFGEINDTYARCAIGQLGKLHYLAMAINVEVPDYNVYVTLRQAADSIIAHGCTNAYTIDGGQTASIIIGNRLINPVQFGKMREMSDIFYFATAIPEE